MELVVSVVYNLQTFWKNNYRLSFGVERKRAVTRKTFSEPEETKIISLHAAQFLAAMCLHLWYDCYTYPEKHNQ